SWVREPPIALADRRTLPSAKLCPHASLARTHRAGRGQLEESFHPLRPTAEPLSPSCRRCRRSVAMNDAAALPESESKKPREGEALGRVGSPPMKESTSDFFYFWAERGKLVERNQIVSTSCLLGGRSVEFVGLVEEVYRQSGQHDMREEVDRYDAVTSVEPPFASAGFTYAKVTILRTSPVTHAPPLEESIVRLGGEREAEKGYGIDRMRPENRLKVGRLRNGGTDYAGPAVIDLAYLLGENGGHLNVNGIAGLGAKSSFLLHVVNLLMRRSGRPGDPARARFVPIIFNVKGLDLFYIDRWNRNWRDEY